MMTRTTPLLLVVFTLILVAAGCGAKPAPPTSTLDSPEYHYRAGLKYLETDQVDGALKAFERAISLNPDSPLGHIGKGLALGRKGDFKSAFDSIEEGKDLDKKGVEGNIGMIRLHSMQRGEDWLKNSEKEYKEASEKEPGNGRLHYYMGMAYKFALDFDRAGGMFKKTVELNKEFTGEANAEWALVQKIQRAAPGTVIGKQIALIEKIDRADVAALFDQEMDLEKLYTKRGTKLIDTTFKAPTETSTRFSPEKVEKMEAATDIADHWLKPSIDLVLKLRVRGLEAGPDHTFAPDKLITKSEFALMLEDVLIRVSGDEKLATKYLGATSPFPDVRNDHYAFSAIMTAASRGYLEADKATGEFRPVDPVSGADALLTIREFKNQLKF